MILEMPIPNCILLTNWAIFGAAVLFSVSEYVLTFGDIDSKLIERRRQYRDRDDEEHCYQGKNYTTPHENVH